MMDFEEWDDATWEAFDGSSSILFLDDNDCGDNDDLADFDSSDNVDRYHKESSSSLSIKINRDLADDCQAEGKHSNDEADVISKLSASSASNRTLDDSSTTSVAAATATAAAPILIIIPKHAHTDDLIKYSRKKRRIVQHENYSRTFAPEWTIVPPGETPIFLRHPACRLATELHQLSKLPRDIFHALNCGHHQLLSYLMDTSFDDNCYLRMSSPRIHDIVGTSRLKEFYLAWMNAFPDILTIVTDVYMEPTTVPSIQAIRCKIKHSGTVGHIHYMEKFMGQRYPKNIDIVNEVATSKTTDEDIRVLRDLIQSIRREQQMLRIFGKLKISLYFDIHRHKIVGYDQIHRLVSFTGVNM